ncbi:MAG: hypothetical protein FD138_3059 [Planctomycetota bacterium]|nr:MAG: hypothetical protein FD138_3059 [Planctomycetota bacterium]
MSTDVSGSNGVNDFLHGDVSGFRRLGESCVQLIALGHFDAGVGEVLNLRDLLPPPSLAVAQIRSQFQLLVAFDDFVASSDLNQFPLGINSASPLCRGVVDVLVSLEERAFHRHRSSHAAVGCASVFHRQSFCLCFNHITVIQKLIDSGNYPQQLRFLFLRGLCCGVAAPAATTCSE